MELRNLKSFLVLSETLHFGKAAEKLYISQPPLSRMIKSMEKELDTQLFERNNKKVKLTKYGEYLQSEAYKLISHVDSIKYNLELLKNGISNPIRIGYAASVMYCFLPEILDKFKTKFPRIETNLIELVNASQLKALKTGDLEIGFIRTPENDKELVFEHIIDEPYTLILSSKHKLARKNKTMLKELKNDPFISFSKTCSVMIGINSIFRKNGIIPNTVHQTSQINTILRLVESNVGYSIIPSTVLKGFDLKIKRYELNDYNERTPIYIAYNKANQTDILKEFIEITRNHSVLI